MSDEHQDLQQRPGEPQQDRVGEWTLLELKPGGSAAHAAEQAHQAAVRRIEAETDERVLELIERQLGHHGRMISASKSRYVERHPTRLAVFNANLLVNGWKLWWGDLDLTLDEPKLRRIARELGCQLHVLREHDGRFDKEDAPLVEQFVYRTDGAKRELGPSERDKYEWRHGKIRRRRPPKQP